MRLSKKLDFLGVTSIVLCLLALFLGNVVEDEEIAAILYIFGTVLFFVGAALAICRLLTKRKRRRFRPDKSLRVKSRRKKVKNAPTHPRDRKNMTLLTDLEDYEEATEPQGFSVDEEVIEENNPEQYQTFTISNSKRIRKRVKKK